MKHNICIHKDVILFKGRHKLIDDAKLFQAREARRSIKFMAGIELAWGTFN